MKRKQNKNQPNNAKEVKRVKADDLIKKSKNQKNGFSKKNKDEPKGNVVSTTFSDPVKLLPATRQSDAQVSRKINWINRERVLFVPSRGISAQARHFMLDMLSMMPHAKKEAKFHSKRLVDLVDVAEAHSCSKLIFIETRKHLDTYVWFVCLPDGPSIKCHMEYLSTSQECRFTGNALKHSRPILSFSGEFEDTAQSKDQTLRNLVKEILTQTFGTPKEHPKSQPFIDKIFHFSWLDDRIWFRCYQIDHEEGGQAVEMGPRFTMRILNVFGDAFGGPVIYKTPFMNTFKELKRKAMSEEKATMYANRQLIKQMQSAKPPPVDEEDVTNTLFE